MSSPTPLLTFSEGESERSHFSTAQESPRLVRPPRTHLFNCASLFPALADGLASVGCYGGPLLSFVRLFVRFNLVNHRLHCLIPSLEGEISCVVVACECLLRRLSSRSVKASRSGLTSQRHKRVLGWFYRYWKDALVQVCFTFSSAGGRPCFGWLLWGSSSVVCSLIRSFQPRQPPLALLDSFSGG